MKNKKIKALFIAPDLFVPENKNGTNKTIFNILKENEYLSVDFLYPSLSSEPIELEQEFSNVNLIPVKVKDMDESSYLVTCTRNIFSYHPAMYSDDMY